MPASLPVPSALDAAYPSRGARVAGFALLLAAIAVPRYEIVSAPPYGNAALGIFVAADDLVEYGFDIRRALAPPREGWWDFGPLPTLAVAALMAALPSPRAVLIACHVFVFACGAAIGLLVFAILRPRAGPLVAALTTAVALSTPLIATQFDLLGREAPFGAASLAAVALFLAGRRWAGMAAALASFLISAYAVVIVAAIAVTWLLAAAADKSRTPGRGRLPKNTVLLLALAIVLALTAWQRNEIISHAPAFNAQSLRQSLTEIWTCCPDIVLLAALVLVGVAVVTRRNLPAARRTFVTDPGPCLAALVIALGTAAVILTGSIPRDLFVPTLFLILAAGALLAHVRYHGLAAGCAAILVGFNLANADGRVFGAFPDWIPAGARSSGLLERSREYLVDHRANVETIGFLAEHCAGRTIVAGSPLAEYLALPRLGYVERGLSGVATTANPPRGFRAADTAVTDPPQLPVFVWLDNRPRQASLAQVPPAEPRDKVLFTDRHPARPAVVYEKNFPPTATDLQLRIVSVIWPPPRLHARAVQLLGEDRRDLAETMLTKALELDPTRLDSRYELARLMIADRRYDAAIEHLQIMLAQRPQALPHRMLAEVYYAQGRRDDARAALLDALRYAPSDGALYEMLGNLLVESGEAQQALAVADQWQRRAGQRARVLLLSAGALTALGRDADARAALEESLRLAPDNIQALLQLGDLEKRAGNPGRAVALYEQALQLDGASIAALNRLAWIMATSPDATLRNGPRAVELAAAMCEVNTRPTAGMLDTLAAAYAEAGRFDDAVATATRAIDLARAANNEPSAAAYAARADLYRARQPFRDAPR